MSRPRIAKSLRALEKQRLIERFKKGRKIHYRYKKDSSCGVPKGAQAISFDYFDESISLTHKPLKSVNYVNRISKPELLQSVNHVYSIKNQEKETLKRREFEFSKDEEEEMRKAFPDHWDRIMKAKGYTIRRPKAPPISESQKEFLNKIIPEQISKLEKDEK